MDEKKKEEFEKEEKEIETDNELDANTDIVDIILSCTNETLGNIDISWKNIRKTHVVILSGAPLIH